MTEYNLIISGTIGAGKSTNLEKIVEYLRMQGHKVGVINEYLQIQSDGMQKLSDWVSGRINIQEFHDYIAECIRINLDIVHNMPIKVYHRSPFESAEIFCKDQYCYKHISQVMNELHDEYKIPYPNKDNVIVIDAKQSLDEIFTKIKAIIDDDLCNHIKDRIIYLRIDLETCIDRIKKRGRGVELVYPEAYLLSLIELYDSLYLFIK